MPRARADFGVRPPVYVLHDHHSSQTRRKLTEGLPEAMPELELIDPALGLGVCCDLRVRQRRLSAVGSVAGVVAAGR